MGTGFVENVTLGAAANDTGAVVDPGSDTNFFTADHTHTTPVGAEINAGCVAEGLRRLSDSSLAKYFLAKPAAAATLDPNR